MMHVIHRSNALSFSKGLGHVNLVFPFLFKYIEQGIYNWLNSWRLLVSEHRQCWMLEQQQVNWQIYEEQLPQLCLAKPGMIHRWMQSPE